VFTAFGRKLDTENYIQIYEEINLVGNGKRFTV